MFLNIKINVRKFTWKKFSNFLQVHSLGNTNFEFEIEFEKRIV